MVNKKNQKKYSGFLKLLSAELIITLLILLVAITLFAYSVNMVFIKKETHFDENMFQYISDHVRPFRTDVLLFISFLGKHTFLIPANICLTLYYLYVRKNEKLTTRIAAIALSSLCLMFILKLTFQRQRPDIPLLEKVSGFSFPSGHALMSVAFYGLFCYIAWMEIRNRVLKISIILVLVLLILLIGYSRLYLRLHFASDILAGYAVGVAWLLFSLWIIGMIEKKRFARNALKNIKGPDLNQSEYIG